MAQKISVFTYGSIVASNSISNYIGLSLRRQKAVQTHVQNVQDGYGKLVKIWENWKDTGFKDNSLCEEAKEVVAEMENERNKQFQILEQMKGR